MGGGAARGGGPRSRGWLVLAVAAVGGVIAGVALERSGARMGIPSLVAPPAAGDLLGHAPRRSAPSPAVPTPPAPIAALAGLPAYPGATPRGLGDDVVAAGMPMAIAWFTTPDPPADVMSFYENAFEATHAHVVHEWATKVTGYVGWRDEKTGELHGVVVRREGQETMVLPSVVAPGRLKQGAQRVPASLPQPKGGEQTVVVSMAGDAPGTREVSVVTTVPLTTVRSLAGFYRQGFADKGWHVEQFLVNSPAFARVTATRDEMRAEAYLQQAAGGDAGPHVDVYVILTTRDHA